MDSPPEGLGKLMAAGAASLRDTAKWLVAGVVATAASVFAGSSLTKFGSLAPAQDQLRFGLAIGGLVIGFVGLAMILVRAIAVLTLESITYRQLANALAAGQPTEFAALGWELLKKYDSLLPPELPRDGTALQAYIACFDAASDGSATSRAYRKKAVAFTEILMADAAFLSVRARFRKLVVSLYIGTSLAALGFGLFAWAANPPDPPPAKPCFQLSIAEA